MFYQEVVEGQCLVMPEHINTKEHFWEAFGQVQMESAANLVVRLCQAHGSWVAFTEVEYEAAFPQRYHLGGLIAGRWLNRGEDMKLRVTIGFIARCWGASPKVAVPVPAREKRHRPWGGATNSKPRFFLCLRHNP